MGPGRRQRFCKRDRSHLLRDDHLISFGRLALPSAPCSPRGAPCEDPVQCTVLSQRRRDADHGQNNGGAVARTPGRDYIHVHGSTQQALSEGERPTCPCKKCKNAKSITRLALPSAASGASPLLTSLPSRPWPAWQSVLAHSRAGLPVLLEATPPSSRGADGCFSSSPSMVRHDVRGPP
jgi:hypothetical protein